MVVGVCRLNFFFPESDSLKAKRHHLRKIIDRVKAKFNAAIAEVANQDIWQRGTLGLVVVGNEGAHVQSMLDNITFFISDLYVGQLLNREVELLAYSDNEIIGGHPTTW